MGSSGSQHIVESGSQATFTGTDSYSHRNRNHGRGILSGFLKNYETSKLYGLTAGTNIKLGQSFCIDIPQVELGTLPREFHPYIIGNLVEIGKCILKIDEMKSFRPCLNYSNCTNAALIEIHDELRRYFILDLRDAKRNQQAVTVRDPVPGRHVYYQCDSYKTDCTIGDVNDGVFSVKCKKAFDSIKDDHIGALIRRDDDDRHTSVFGLLFTTVHRCGWAAPMRTVLTRLKEEIGFEVEFLQVPRKPLLAIGDPSLMTTTGPRVTVPAWLGARSGQPDLPKTPPRPPQYSREKCRPQDSIGSSFKKAAKNQHIDFDLTLFPPSQYSREKSRPQDSIGSPLKKAAKNQHIDFDLTPFPPSQYSREKSRLQDSIGSPLKKAAKDQHIDYDLTSFPLSQYSREKSRLQDSIGSPLKKAAKDQYIDYDLTSFPLSQYSREKSRLQDSIGSPLKKAAKDQHIDYDLTSFPLSQYSREKSRLQDSIGSPLKKAAKDQHIDYDLTSFSLSQYSREKSRLQDSIGSPLKKAAKDQHIDYDLTSFPLSQYSREKSRLQDSIGSPLKKAAKDQHIDYDLTSFPLSQYSREKSRLQDSIGSPLKKAAKDQQIDYDLTSFPLSQYSRE